MKSIKTYNAEYIFEGKRYATQSATLKGATELAKLAKKNKKVELVEIIGLTADGEQAYYKLVFCAECKSPVPHNPICSFGKATGKIHCTCSTCF